MSGTPEPRHGPAAAAAEPAVPAPYVEFPDLAGFIRHVGPLYWVPEKDDFRLAFRVREEHINIGGIAHGGMLLTVADMVLALGSRVILGVESFLPTIHMDCDFLAPARLGDWVEGRILLTQATPRTVFATCLMTVGEEDILRASGIMKILRREDGRFKLTGRDPLKS